MPNRSSPFRTRRALLTALAAACALWLPAATAHADPIESGTAVQSDLSPPLRTLQPKHAQSNAAHPARRFGKTLDELRLAPRDRGRQAVDAPAAAPIPGSQWEGVGNVNGVIPPDTNGDVGPRDYVQWVNLSFQVFSKDGTSRYGPVPGNTLWQGFPGVCGSGNQGDPIAIYDRGADRWVMSQFGFAVTKGGHDAPPYYECVAVSQTGDPTGAYYRYAFQLTGATNNFPDYPKFGVWNDAYYVTTNNFGSSFVGAGIYALDRTKMLAGDASAGFVGQQLASQYGGLLPAHRDGPTPPPAGAPGYFAGIDTDTGSTGSNLLLWKMHPDFANPLATTVSGPTLIPVNTYTFGFCGSNFSDACIPQQGTSMTLDPLADRLMNRLEYRNFGDHESLLLSHNVNAGSNQAGERWYELRDVATSPTVYQQGTYAPADGVSRWMGSAAMDGYGDIALGYSASSTTSRPSIRYTGRLGGDPLGSMTTGEQTIQAGGGSQTGYSRWGDYSSMSIDPVDDSTFWYTNEYYTTTSSSSWHTRIASFKLVSTPTVTIGAPADGGASTGTPALSGSATGGTGDVTIKVYSGGSTSGALLQTLTATPSSGNWNATAGALAEGTYTAQAQQSDGSGHVGYSPVSTFRVDSTPPVVAVNAPANGALTNDSTPTVTGTAGTGAGDLTGVTVRIHTGPSVSDPVAQTLSATRNGAGAWSVTPSSAVADGQHAVEALQSDSAGNTGTSAANVFTIDTVAPLVSITSPAAGAFTNDTTPGIAGNASSGDAATVTVRIYAGSSASGTPIQTLSPTQSSGNWSTAAATLAQGTFTARAQQLDAAGNTGLSAPVTFVVDTTAPALTLTSPAAGALTNDSTPAFGGARGSAAGDLAAVSVKVYSGTDTTVAPVQTPAATVGPTSWSATPSALGDGTYTVVAEQSDSATNKQTKQATFTIDTQAPVVTVTTPADNSTTPDNTPTFTGTASDPGQVTVQLTGAASRTLNATPSSGAWSVTPGSPLPPGGYTAVASQGDTAGNTGSSAPVHLVVGTNTAPVASFGFSPASPLTGALVAFDGSGSSDAEGPISVWAWAFGDGATGSGVTTSHAYSAAGAYTAQLTVTDGGGATASTTRPVTVTAPPATPGVEPAPVPQAIPVIPAALAPRLSLRLTQQRLGRVLRRGLVLVAGSDQDGTVTLQLVVSRRVARALHLGRRLTIARLSGALHAGTPARLVLGLSRAARTQLAGRSRLTARLRMTLGPTTLEQAVTLRR